MPYFRTLFPVPSDILAIHRLFVQVIEGYQAMAAARNSTASRQARLAISSYADFLTDLTVIAERTAELANRLIPDLYDASRVGRPHTPGPAHLRDALPTSEEVDTGLPSGTVGVVDLDALEKFVYWKAQEFGSDHMVGREIKGFFDVPGKSAPDPAQFRHHALFFPTGGRGRTAHFENPIPEGRFIRDGLELIEAFWSAEMAAAGGDAISDLRAVRGLARGQRLSRGVRDTKFRRLTSARTVNGLRNALGRY